MVDGLDALIEKETIKEPASGDPPPGDSKPGGEPKVGDLPKDQEPPKTGGDPEPKQGTPKEILGIDGDWEGVKAKLGETENLRSELELAKNQPKVNFANENVAAFNKFVADKGIDDYNVFRRLTATDLTDPLQVLVTKFVLDNPKFSGQEDKVLKKLAAEYKVDSVEYPNEDVEFNKIKLDADADAARNVITGLRESLKTPNAAPAQKPEEIAARETQWKEGLSKELMAIDKISIPTLHPDKKDEKGNPMWEKYSEYEIPKELRQQWVNEIAPIQAKLNNATPEQMKNVIQSKIANFITNNFGAIIHSVITKERADTRLAVEAEYDGAKKLKDNDPPPTGAEKDPYKTMWGD